MVTTVGRADSDQPWPGTTRPDEPFDITCSAGMVQVHANGSRGWVTDVEGTELGCGHQRP